MVKEMASTAARCVRRNPAEASASRSGPQEAEASEGDTSLDHTGAGSVGPLAIDRRSDPAWSPPYEAIGEVLHCSSDQIQPVTRADIRAGFERLGMVGQRVVVHSSLRSFGHVDGGADAVVDALVGSFETILVPAFSWDSNAPPPPDDRPRQNGCDYAFYDNWTKPPKPFRVESAGIEVKMGVISRRFSHLPGVQRSDHPWHSWAAYGALADLLVRDHPWETTNLPIERLADLGGYVLLLGVTLSSCTAIHVAEERAGRRPFIRWMTDRDGQVRRVRASGCAKGFDHLMPHCADLFSETYVGCCRMLAAPLSALIDRAAAVIASRPGLTACSETCIRCRDMILGGPLDTTGSAGPLDKMATGSNHLGGTYR